MSIDLGNAPVGTPPDSTQQQQIRSAIGAVGDAPSDGEKYVMLDGEWVLLNPPSSKAYDSGNNVLFEEASDAIPDYWTQTNSAAVASVSFTSTVTSIGAAALRGTSITSLTIPDSVTSLYNTVAVGRGSFSACTSLTSVTIGSGLTSIGAYAFDGCSSLSSITIPNNITNIGWGSFRGTALTSVTIPANVTSLGGYTFMNCYSLGTVNILAMTAPSLGGYDFVNCYSLSAIHVPIGSTGYGYTYGGKFVIQDL